MHHCMARSLRWVVFQGYLSRATGCALFILRLIWACVQTLRMPAAELLSPSICFRTLQAALDDALERVRQVLASSHDLVLQVCLNQWVAVNKLFKLSKCASSHDLVLQVGHLYQSKVLHSIDCPDGSSLQCNSTQSAACL